MTTKVAEPQIMKANEPRKNVSLLGLRTKTPLILRSLAVTALVIIIGLIGFQFYKGRKPEFRMISGLAELSKDVTAVVNGYERRETDGNVLKYFVKADKATTFSDNHQELENVYLEAYDEKGEKFDKISANRAVYIPAENKNFTAHFFSNVNIETRDGLKVKSEQLTYERAAEKASTNEPIEFVRGNLSGKSTGMIALIKDKHLELIKDVELNSSSAVSAEDTKVPFQSAKIIAGHAIYDQNNEQINLEQNVFINVVPLNNSSELSQPTDIRAEKATAYFENKEIKKIDLTQNVEVFSKPTEANKKSTKIHGNAATALFDKELNQVTVNENVEIETTNDDSKPTVIHAQNAVYEKPADKFSLHNNVEIITNQNAQPTIIHSNEAIYEQTGGRVFLNGAAEITQGSELIKGDVIHAQLFPDKKLQNAYSRGNAYLKQTLPDRTTEVTSNELNATFGVNAQIQNANATGAATVSLNPAQNQNYSKATISAPNSIHLDFRPTNAQSVLSQMQTDGRTTIVMNPSAGNPKSALRKITADTVKTTMSESGKDLQKAEAVGNGEIYVEPVQAAPENYKTTINAPRFDCDFFEGNNAKVCTAIGKTKTVLVPMVPAETRGTRTLLADKLTTNFSQINQDIESFDAEGNAKFSELDRNGVANQIVYTANDQIVRLRGGEPTIWNSESRAKAGEIDWDTKNQKSALRNKVSTTYYSQKQTNGATPFAKSSVPVFVTANEANFDHLTKVGVYTGNARAWQDNNYVRADRLILQEKSRRMDGEGKVQSLLYNLRRKEGEKETNQPAFATSNKITYTNENKLVHYAENVDIRQGTDRILCGSANIYMNENNEAKQTILENNVIITQPNRRITGDWAQYTTADEVVILRGNPATVTDAESGMSQGSQMTISMRDNRMVNQGAPSKNTPGRTRSVYKVKP